MKEYTKASLKTPVFICALVFSLLAVIYGIVAGVLYIFIDQIKESPYSEGNVEVLPLVFFILFAVFALAGIILWLVFKKKLGYIKKLIETGRVVYATVIEASPNYMVKINGIHPLSCICKASDDFGEEKIYTCKGVLAHKNDVLGSQATVYVSRENPEEYYVVLDPKKR